MSVPKGKRGESDVEFLRTARELQLYTIKKCVGFPKRYTFYVSQPIAECATRTYEYLKCANSLYPTNQHEAQRRIDYELHASAELNSLVSQLEVAAELFGIEPDKLKCWMELVEREMRLVKALIKKDRERYRMLV